MNAPDSGETLFLRDEGRRARASGLPPDVLAQSARRLCILALLYACVFFMADFFPALLDPRERADLFSNFIVWGPGAIAIAVALLVATLTRSPPIPLWLAMYIGLGFEVASSFGIAAAEFLDPTALDFNVQWVGLSWVAVWTLLFTVVVPSPPLRGGQAPWKGRPALVISVRAEDIDRALVTLVPHTTSLRQSRFEAAVSARFCERVCLTHKTSSRFRTPN